MPTLRDRLPADLRDGPRGPEFDALPFTPLYLTDDEWAAEIANETVHGVMHIGWVPDGTGGFRGQMAVLVKPNGLFGTAYLAAIKPFRHLIVYPPMLREGAQAWRAAAGDAASATGYVDPHRDGPGRRRRPSGPMHAAQNEYFRAVPEPSRAAPGSGIVWTVPGESGIAGTYRGLEEVLGYFRATESRPHVRSTDATSSPGTGAGSAPPSRTVSRGSATATGAGRPWACTSWSMGASRPAGCCRSTRARSTRSGPG